MDKSIYSGLWAAFGGSQYKFGPYYREIFDIINNHCKDSIDIFHSVDYDININISRNNIVLGGLNRDQCEVFDIYSLIIVFVFCFYSHRNRNCTVRDYVFNRIMMMSDIFSDDIRDLFIDNPIESNYDKIFKVYSFEGLSQSMQLILSKELGSDLADYFNRFISMRYEISKTYAKQIKYFYWLEDSLENIRYNDVDIYVNVLDNIDMRTASLDDNHILDVLNYYKQKYNKQVLNRVSSSFRWRPTLEVFAYKIFEEISNHIQCVISIEFSTDEESVIVYKDSYNLTNFVNHCTNIGASL